MKQLNLFVNRICAKTPPVGFEGASWWFGALKSVLSMLSGALKSVLCLLFGTGDGTDRVRVEYVSSTSRLRVWTAIIPILITFTLGVGQVWGADPDHSFNESWSFSTSGNSNWSSINCNSYCGGWGKNKDASPSVYKTNIQNFKDVDFSLYENVSLTIYVTAGTNSGTNSYTVKLIDKDGNQVSTYSSTKTNGMGSGSNASSAKESSVTFSPTTAFTGYRIDFNPKAFITQTRYVLTYDDKAASCSNTPTMSFTPNSVEKTVGDANFTKAVSISGKGGSQTVAYSSSNTSVATVNSSTGEVTIKTNGSTTITASVSESGDYCSASASYTLTVNKPSYTVNWYVGGTQVKTESVTKDEKATLPSTPADNALGGSCSSLEFMGWSETNIGSTGTTAPADLFTAAPTVTSAKNYYAVFAEADEGESSTYSFGWESADDATKWTLSNFSDKATYNSYKSAGSYAGSNGTSTTAYIQYKTKISPTAISCKYTKATSNTNSSSKFIIQTSANGSSWTDRQSGKTMNNVSQGTFETLSWSGSLEDVYVRIYLTTTATTRVIDEVSITVGGETTYSNYITTCCTPLGSVSGTITSNSPTSLTLSWSAVTGAEKYQVKVPGSSSHNGWTDVNATSVTVTKSCGTAYTAYFRAVDTNGSHCSEGPESTLAIPAQSWTVTSTGVTNVTASPAIPSTTCSGFNTTITAATGYALPSEITVTNADKTWNSSTGALAISNVTGNVTITIAGTCVAPDITVHPASANYVADPVAAATALSVTASAAGANLDYQWQSKVGEGAWTDIQGATNSTYTPSRTTAGVTQYRVVLTNHTCSESSNSNAATITVTVPSVCIAPTFDPEEGTYTGTQSVVLASETTGATVYYTMTTDGSEPATPTSGSTAYSSAISVTENTRIKAIAIKDGMEASSVQEAEYIIQCETPVISPAAGTYTGTKSVTITCATDDATIYYTTDGSTPDNTKTEYTGAFDVANNQTVKAIAIKSNMANSAVASAAYLIKCETPVISPAAGTHTGAQDVTITCATDGATIYYTTDGSDPDNTKTEYTGSFKVTNSKTVKAIAIKSGMENSAIASAAYTIQYTLTFKNNGTTLASGGTKNLAPGATYGTLPTLTAGDACDGTSTTFMGWSTAEISEKQSAAPASYASATSVMGAGDVVLNAVWAKQDGHEGYDLVSSLTAGKKYVFASSNTAGSAYAVAATSVSTSTGSGVKASATSITISSGTPVYIATENEALEFAYDGTDYEIVGTLATETTKKYLYINGNGISRRTDKRAYWDNNKGLYGQNNGGDKNYYLYLSGTEFDKKESPASGERVYAFEKQEASYEDYITSCCTDWSASAPAISYSTPAHWKAGDDDVAVTIASGDTYGAVSFESSDEAVLTVDAETGEITAVAMGTATVTATWAGGVVLGTRYCAASSSVEVSVSGTLTVTFDGNDATSGTMSDQVMYYNEATALKANAFSKDGYTFYGWAETDEKADAGNRDYEGGESVTFTTNKTLYAVWQASVHNLTLTQPTVSAVAAGTITANGSTTSPASMAYGASVTLAASENSSALDGYVFENWSVTGITLADATANPAVFTMPDNDVSVAAVYHHYTWDLTGYIVETAPGTLYSVGDKFSKASVAIQAGYERSDNSSTKQVTLDAAEWTAKLNGSVIADNYTFVIGDNGKTLTLWVGESKVGNDYVLTVNAIPTDKFVVNIWDVSAPADKTSDYSMPSISNQTEGAAATCKDHNLFVGWVEEGYKDEPEGHIVAANTAMTPSNKTYYAVWGKTGTITNTISYGWETGDSKDGWTINGNNTNSTYKHNGEKSGSYSTAGYCIKTTSSYASPKSLKAYVSKATNNTNSSNLFRIDYSATGTDNSWNTIVSSDNFSDMSRGVFEELSADLTSYTNKYFRIFFANATAEGLVDDVEFVYTTSGPVDYITDCVQRYQVTFDANGGTGSYDAIEKKEGSTVTLPDGSALSRAAEHYHFNGWKVYNASTEAEISVSNNQFTMPGAAVNAVAQWEEDPKGTVRYVGDEITNSSVTRYAGQTYDLRTEVSLPANRKLVGWMLDGDETLYAPGRTMTMPDPVQDYMYHVQIIDQLPKPSGVSFSDGEWVLVTDENQLHAGDFVVIVANGTTNAMGAQSTSNRSVASVTKHNEGQTITLSSGVATLFLQYGYKEGEFALYDMAENGYLYANSNTQNQLKTTTEYSNRNYSWKITIGEGNIASIVAQGANTHNNLQYNPNNGSPLFACYTGGQTAVQLYRYEGYQTVTITEDVNASNIYITNADVVVEDGATLTVDAAYTISDLTVEVGGKVTNELYNLTVNNLTIESMAGKSGQLIGASNVTVNGKIYMDIKFYSANTLDATSADQWYMISAPFAVNLYGGFFQTDGTPMVFGTDFDLFTYDGNKRATTGVTGWARVNGQMPAGKACLIGFNEGQATTIRLQAASNTVSDPTSIALQAFTGDDDNQNWNGVANPRLRYTSVDKDVQVWNNEEGENGRKYTVFSKDDYSFVVGTPFFVQATGTMSLEGDLNSNFRAPKQSENTSYEYCVRIAREGATEFADQMYVRASEEAVNAYEQGHDMITWNGTTGKSAMIWSENYGGKRLAIEEAPLMNEQASYTLGIFAPNAGTYTITVPTERTDASLYLTKDGNIIWDLTMSPYEAELVKGQNSGYGLLLQKKVPQTPTGIENGEVLNGANGVQKVIINDHVYILRAGQLFDVTGKAVK